MSSTDGAEKGTILVVEDDAGVLRLVRVTLEKEGYRVLEATDVDQALEVAGERAGEIRLLITDLIMPHRNGRKLAEQILAGDPTVKVLFMSGYTADLLEEEDADIEGLPFLSKPFTPRTLAAKVHEILRGRETLA